MADGCTDVRLSSAIEPLKAAEKLAVYIPQRRFATCPDPIGSRPCFVRE